MLKFNRKQLRPHGSHDWSLTGCRKVGEKRSSPHIIISKAVRANNRIWVVLYITMNFFLQILFPPYLFGVTFDLHWVTLSPEKKKFVQKIAVHLYFFVLVLVQCELGEWSQWGTCMKKNKICGFKKGNQSRRREPTQPPSPATVTALASTCTSETESRRCTVQKKIPCAKGKSWGRHISIFFYFTILIYLNVFNILFFWYIHVLW